MRAIPERLRGVFMTRRYTNPRLPYHQHLQLEMTEKHERQAEQAYPSLVVGFDLECIESAWKQAGHSTLCIVATVDVPRTTHVTTHSHQVLKHRRSAVVLRVLCDVHTKLTDNSL